MSFGAGIVVALATLLGNAFFVGAEFGLVSARRSNVELEALNGSRAAKITLGAMEQVSLMLAGAQLGVTLCSLVFGAVAEPLVGRLLEQPFHALGVNDFWITFISFALALSSMAYVHVVIGEMVPKNLALTEPTRAALLLVPPLFLMVRMIRPLIEALNAAANGTLRLLGFNPRQEMTSSFSRDEVAGFVKESHREGLLSEEEEHLLSGALDFDEQTIKSVILPLEKAIVSSPRPTAEEIERLASDTGFSRFPVPSVAGDLKGYVHLKDMLQVPDEEYTTTLPEKYIRPLVHVKATASLRRTLATMQKSGSHIAQVTDRQGSVTGIVMLEDVLEELVGAIHDDAQKQQPASGGPVATS